MPDIRIDKGLVHKSLYFGVLWLVVAGVLYLFAVPWWSHWTGDSLIPAWSTLGGAIATLGWITSTAFGLTFYLLPMMCECRPVAARMAMFGMWFWNITLGLLLFSRIINDSTAHPSVWPWWSDACFFLALLWIGFSVKHTVQARRVKSVPKPVWFLLAGYGLLGALLLFRLLVLPFLQDDLQDMLQGLAPELLLGLWGIPMAVAVLYFIALPVHNFEAAVNCDRTARFLLQWGTVLLLCGMALLVFQETSAVLLPQEAGFPPVHFLNGGSMTLLLICTLWLMGGVLYIWPRVYVIYSTSRRHVWLGALVTLSGFSLLGLTAVYGVPQGGAFSVRHLYVLFLGLTTGIAFLQFGRSLYRMLRDTPEVTY